jgi:hypothetical protein
MHSPRTLILSIAATGCGFLLALVAVIGQASCRLRPPMPWLWPPGSSRQGSRMSAAFRQSRIHSPWTPLRATPRGDDTEQAEGVSSPLCGEPDSRSIVRSGEARSSREPSRVGGRPRPQQGSQRRRPMTKYLVERYLPG